MKACFVRHERISKIGRDVRSQSESLCFEQLEEKKLLAGVIYGDILEAPFEDWSYDSTVDLANPDPVQSGTSSIAATHQAAWAGLYLGSSVPVPFGAQDEISFSIHGGQGGQQLRVYYVDASYQWIPMADVNPVENQWSSIVLDFPAFGTPSDIRGVVFQEFTGAASDTFFIDEVEYGDFLPDDSGDPLPGPAIIVDLNNVVREISEDIYGLNFADPDFADEIDLPVNRWGGNSTSRYNWELDATNLAADWYFENYPANTVNTSTLPFGSTADYFVGDNIASGADSIITVGTMGWAAASREIKGSFPVDVFGDQQSVDPYHPNWGNGISTDGSLITGNDPFYNNLETTDKFAHRWVEHLVGQYGRADEGGVKYYALDNEPMLWNSTHRDVHPEPASYLEVLNRGLAYASSIKQADPTAQVLGPTAWGWTAYHYSALDAAAGGNWWENPQDRIANGGLPFLQWYLEKFSEHEIKTGTRLLDYLDVHYYPQNPGVALDSAGDSATQAQRLESTRSLWDSSYVDETWINEEVMLIPRMRNWIDSYYPETKLAITEYNWGGHEHINGAVAQADVLGIFGREGVDLATLWAPPAADQPAAYSFRMFRNYDGLESAGSKFGNLSLMATSDDAELVSVFAANRSHDDATTIVLVNKSTDALSTPIDVGVAFGDANVEVYQYDSSNLNQIEREADLFIDDGQATVVLPAYSITLLELPATNGFAPGPGSTGEAIDGERLSLNRSGINIIESDFGWQDFSVKNPSSGDFEEGSEISAKQPTESSVASMTRWAAGFDVAIFGSEEGEWIRSLPFQQSQGEDGLTEYSDFDPASLDLLFAKAM